MFLKMLFFYTVRYLVPYIPHSLLMKIADVTGNINKNGTKGKITQKQVRRLLGDTISEEEINRIVLESMRDFHKDLFEIWCFPTLTKKKIEKITVIEGREYLDDALNTGKGAIIGVTHFGSWKILIAALGYAGYKINQIALNPLDSDNANNTMINNVVMRLEYECEKSLPAHFIYIGHSMREVFQALENNEVVIMSMDGVARRREKAFKLMNTTSALDVSPLKFAMKKKIPFLPTFAIRGKNNRNSIVIHKPLDLSDSKGMPATLDQVFFDYIKILEQNVREHPSHYVRSLYVFATQWNKQVYYPDSNLNKGI